MRKFTLLGMACCFGMAAFAADDYVEPKLFEDEYAQIVSPNGKFIMLQDIFLNTYLYNVETGEKLTYQAAYPGDGNCVANNGFMVGQGVESGKAEVMVNGVHGTPVNFSTYPLSQFNAITPDAKRIVGHLSNSGAIIYLPIYVDVDENGNVGRPQLLPYPNKDLFGETPQGIEPHVISADGSVIGGLVISGDGFYNYPIIYTLGENGKYTYTLPTAATFNPDNKPLPKFPDDGPMPPKPRQYMTSEQYEAFMKALAENPNLEGEEWQFMSEEKRIEYEEAIAKYNKEAIEWGKKVDEYWDQMYALGADQFYGGSMAITPDGTRLYTQKEGMPESGANTEPVSYHVYCFNTETNEYGPISKDVDNLLVNQALDDGTVLAMSAPVAFIPYTAYIHQEGQDGFSLFTDFLQENYPQYYPWVEDTFMLNGIIGYDEDRPIYGDYIVTGLIAVSPDFSVIVGGYAPGQTGILSYLFTDKTIEDDGVDEILAGTEDEVINVYNLSGIRVLHTSDRSALQNLPKGIYIVNGKKVVL